MNGLTLTDLADIGRIVMAGSLFVGIVFGWLQIRQCQAQRRAAIATNLMQTFYNNDLAHAIAILQPLPGGIGLEELQSKGPDYQEAAVTIATTFETMGILVFKHIASLELVLDLAGGIITTMSHKLTNWQQDMRDSLNQPSWGEWFEWLGHQAGKYMEEREPAHIKYHDWRP
jgi:hypothetical protein